MKTAILLLALLIAGIGAVDTNAQVPSIQVFFESHNLVRFGVCEGIGEPEELYVVCRNFNALISTVEFGVDFDANWPLVYLADVHNQGALWLGVSYSPDPAGVSGVTITYPTPINGFDPFIAMRISALWDCDDCWNIPWQVLRVIPHETTGNLQAIVFNTFGVINAIGRYSFVCASVATEESTWGRVKALYR